MGPKKSKTEVVVTQPRPPIVVILGHVDHGKTSILDYIRKSKVAEKESGGITQHIGAYQITHSDKTITFIDTPGHEAFSAMRSRGAKVADIAVLVVAAEEGLKPQTKEAISIVLRLNLPLIVAINKMDKPSALPEKVKKQLAEANVLVESMGGQIPSVLTSAKTGLGINELLDLILLLGEMEELKGDSLKPANGIIIESRLDPRRGATATLLIRDGQLSSQNIVAAESAFGQIKTMEDFLGENIALAKPSMPVLVTGFDQVPPVGEEWQVMPSLESAKEQVKIKSEQEKRKREPAGLLELSEDKKIFNFILKADFSGSLEAIQEVLKTIPQDEVVLRVVKAEVGDITENDIRLAFSAKACIYGFRIKNPAAVVSVAQRQNVKVTVFQIIYELIQVIRHDASFLLKPEVNKEKIGRIKILAAFKADGRQQIIGGRVTSGKIVRAAADVYRDEKYLGTAKITQLQQQKKNVNELEKDREGGLMVDSEILIEKGDILEAYKETSAKREL